MQIIKNALIVLPVMGYYLIESMIIALFISFVWNFFLEELFHISISYFQWIGIIWIIKIIFFDVFKLLSAVNNNDNKEIKS